MVTVPQAGCTAGRRLAGGDRRGPGPHPGSATYRVRPAGVGRVHGGGATCRHSHRAQGGGAMPLARRKGVTRAAGEGPSATATSTQALLTGAGRPRVDDGAGALGCQRVGLTRTAPNLPPVSRPLVHLGQGSQVYHVVVAVRTQVSSALPGLVAVLQQQQRARLIRRPAALVIRPLPVHAAAQGRGLWEKAASHRTDLS